MSSSPPPNNSKKPAFPGSAAKSGQAANSPLKEAWQAPPGASTDSVEMRQLMRDGQVPNGFPGPTTVLFICTRTDTGIAPKHIVDIIKVIRPMGIKSFIASPMSPPFGLELKRVADKMINIPAKNFSIGAFFRLRRQILKYGINVIHSHGRTAGVYSRLLGITTKVAVIHTFHGIPIEKTLGGEFRHFIDKLLGMSRFTPVFGSLAEKERALEQKLISTEHEAMLLESSIDLSNFPKRKTTQSPFSKVDRNRPETLNQIRIGGFLRAESTRGHDIFLKLAKETENQGKWSCAGLSRDRVVKFGAPPPGLEIGGPMMDPTKWMYSLDVFVSTSTGDGQIYGALQAMAAGCVCLLSNVPAHQGFLKHQTALLFDPKDSRSFATALNDVRNDKALRDMLLGNARYMLERFHNADTFQGKLVEIYRASAKRTAGLVL
jgi:glycosyltransferase involved in cell wall biosynthesis